MGSIIHMEATTTAVDLIALALWMAAGIFVGVLVTFIFTVILRMFSHKHEILGLAVTRVRISAYIFMIFMGAGVGFEYALDDLRNLPRPPKWVLTSEHVLLILIILSATIVGIRLVGVVEDVARHFSHDSKGGRGMRVVTQTQILSRIVQAVVVVCGATGIIITFPQARLIAGSILASAGVLSIVAGMASQSSLSNMFAGMQIAISDSLRVGDIVVVDNNGQQTQATIEEITLTYIVLRIWDDRRIIMPSIKFTQNSFENWTRRAATLMGTVDIALDWSVSVSGFRRQVDKLLTSTDLWDGRSFSVQVTDVTDNKMTIRVSISARNAGDLWDLRCYLREHLVEWVLTEQPNAVPKTNIVMANTHQLLEINERALLPEAEVTEVEEGEYIELADEVEDKFLVDTKDKLHRKAESEAKVEDKQDTTKAKTETKTEEDKLQVPRTSVKDKGKQDKADKAHIADLEETQIMTTSQIRDQLISLAEIQTSLEEEEQTETSIAMERLYSGSPENEERAKIFDGPGEEVIEEREKSAQLHTRELDELDEDSNYNEDVQEDTQNVDLETENTDEDIQLDETQPMEKISKPTSQDADTSDEKTEEEQKEEYQI